MPQIWGICYASFSVLRFSDLEFGVYAQALWVQLQLQLIRIYVRTSPPRVTQSHQPTIYVLFP